MISPCISTISLYLRGVSRNDLIEAWGEPNRTDAEENSDVWVLEDEKVLTITYNSSGKLNDVEIQVQ